MSSSNYFTVPLNAVNANLTACYVNEVDNITGHVLGLASIYLMAPNFGFYTPAANAESIEIITAGCFMLPEGATVFDNQTVQKRLMIVAQSLEHNGQITIYSQTKPYCIVRVNYG